MWFGIITGIGEAVTIYCRLTLGHSAAEFNATQPPLLLQIHHMFWSVPFFLVAIPFRRRAPLFAASVAGLACGLIASDLIHHFMVLPLWQGNTGWHWP